jgi:hypothetical protein
MRPAPAVMLPLVTMGVAERTPLSEPARALVCHVAAGDPARPTPAVSPDWEEVFRALCHHGLIGLADRWLAGCAADDSPPADFRRWVRQAHLISTLGMARLRARIAPVLAHLSAAGLDLLVLKGPAVAHAVYADPALRSFTDLDIMVRERDWEEVHRLLTALGFEQAEGWPTPPPKPHPRAVVYETTYRSPDRGLLVEVHYDDLLNAGLRSRDIEGFWRRAARIDAGGMPIRTLALEDHLVHLCAHAHFHGYSRVNWFTDLAMLVRDHAAHLDWQGIIRTVRREEAEVPVYYSLIFLERLLGVAAPRAEPSG